MKDGRAGPGPPFFWYDTDFLEFFENFGFFFGGAHPPFFWYDNASGH